MKKIAEKIAFVLIVLMLVSTLTSCELAAIVVGGGAEIVGQTVDAGAAFSRAASDKDAAKKNEFPLYNLKRISKGSYTVEIPAWYVKYKEETRNNAINLLVQFMGYESYDFKMTSEPNKKDNVWKYSITMPGSIPVVKNEKFTYKIADTICTPVNDITFGKSNINGIAYGDGKFVAVGDKKIAYSSDGITWTAVNNISFSVNDIAYGNSKFVAVGFDIGILGHGAGGKIMYSSDGVNWTAAMITPFTPFGKDAIGSIVYGNGMFVAASKDKDGKLAYSPDGIKWTDVKKFPFKIKIIDIAYCGGKFFVFDIQDKGELAYSSDGVNWTAMTNPLGKKNNIKNIVYGNGKFVAVGYDKSRNGSAVALAYSSDGINWTVATSFIYVPMYHTNNNNGIAYGDGKFVAVGNHGNIAYSLDGITWITIADSSAFNSFGINDIVYANGKFFAVGNYGKMAYWDGNIE
jgi:hypothetical protein